MKRRIRLRGISGDVEGKVFEAHGLLQVGRLESLDIALDDTSVIRKHAVLRPTDKGWQLKDLDSTNGTYLNGVKITNEECRIEPRDIIQFGTKATFLVELLEEGARIDDQMVIEAATNTSYEDALRGIAYDRNQNLRPDGHLQTLLRASQYLGSMQSERELLTAILNDAVGTLDAQRGAIVLAEGPNNELKLRAIATGRSDAGGRSSFSQKVAQRCFAQGQSILCCSVDADPELANAQSIHDGAMASVLCVLLRTPRRKLGVIHLDRNHWQEPFTEDDLHLADALAASVSAGLETAHLLRKERQAFHNTIKVFGQFVEMRDRYTSQHTDRVTQYSLLLARQLALPDQELERIEIGTPLHDIGKIGIPDHILNKKGPLTAEEFAIMKTHTVMGATILTSIPDLESVIPIVRSHHEKWDGSGYPDGLKGEAIAHMARIVAVADAFDAMTSDRPYRKGMSSDIAFAEVEKQKGRQFDPECAVAFLAIRDKVERVRKAQAGSVEATPAPSEMPVTIIKETPSRLLVS